MGIDYGMGMTNIDHETGIRYGVISQHELPWWCDESEAVYADPMCPECEGAVIEYDEERHGHYKDGSSTAYWRWNHFEYVCEVCGRKYTENDCVADEPLAFVFDDGEIKCEQGADDTDVFVVKSPFFTLANFCSPCAPGAGYLGSNGNVRTYCLPHDWFEDGIAPYPVFRVSNESRVAPKEA